MYLIYLYFLFSAIQSSNCVVIDKQTNKILPYSTIHFLGIKDGIYADEKGCFLLSEIKTDSIEITNIGYYPLKLKTSKINDTIFLQPKIEVLPEIRLNSNNSKKITIGYYKKKKTLSWYISPKTELATLIKYTKKYKSAYIKAIYIPIEKKASKKIGNKWKSIFPKFNSIFRVHIYSNVNNKPNKQLLNTAITINCNENSTDIIKIDISDENIEFPKEGVFVGVEMIGKLEENKVINNIKSSILPSFQFTKKKKRNIVSESYIKVIFLGNNWINIKDNSYFNAVSKYNMAVSLELSIYD